MGRRGAGRHRGSGVDERYVELGRALLPYDVLRRARGGPTAAGHEFLVHDLDGVMLACSAGAGELLGTRVGAAAPRFDEVSGPGATVPVQRFDSRGRPRWLAVTAELLAATPGSAPYAVLWTYAEASALAG